MTAAVLVDMTCRYCGRECDARKGERVISELDGRTMHKRHVVCPGEEERATLRALAAGGAS